MEERAEFHCQSLLLHPPSPLSKGAQKVGSLVVKQSLSSVSRTVYLFGDTLAWAPDERSPLQGALSLYGARCWRQDGKVMLESPLCLLMKPKRTRRQRGKHHSVSSKGSGNPRLSSSPGRITAGASLQGCGRPPCHSGLSGHAAPVAPCLGLVVASNPDKRVLRVLLPDEQFASVVVEGRQCARDVVRKCCAKRGLDPKLYSLFDGSSEREFADSTPPSALKDAASLALRERSKDNVREVQRKTLIMAHGDPEEVIEWFRVITNSIEAVARLDEWTRETQESASPGLLERVAAALRGSEWPPGCPIRVELQEWLREAKGLFGEQQEEEHLRSRLGSSFRRMTQIQEEDRRRLATLYFDYSAPLEERSSSEEQDECSSCDEEEPAAPAPAHTGWVRSSPRPAAK